MLRRIETPFDILVKNFFQNDSFFLPAQDSKIGYPVDIYENQEGLHFEVACVGLEKSDIELNVEGDLLKISYTKPQDEDEVNVFHYRGISKRSFNLGYKVAPRFNLSEATAEMDKGLLKVSVPFAEEAKPKSLKIK
jgi:HSP20 family protein